MKTINDAKYALRALVMAFAIVTLVAACSGDEPADDLAVRAESLGDAVSESDDSDSDSETDAGASIEAGGEGADGSIEAGDGSADEESTSPQGDDSAVGAEAAAAVGGVLNETGEGLTGAELEEHLARRYEAYWHAFDLARTAPTATPEVDYPVLYSLAAGEQLESTYDELTELHTSGDAVREPDVAAVEGLDTDSARRVRIDSLEGGVAELVACSIYDNVRYNVGTGGVVAEGVRSVQTTTTMARHEGVWKVIRSRATGLEPGVGGCWLEEDAYPL